MRFCLAALAVATSPALAQDWLHVSDTDLFDVYIRTANVDASMPGEYRFWFKGVVKGAPRLVDQENPKSPKYKSYVQYTRVVCASREMASISSLYYDQHGRNIREFKGSPYVLSPVVPDSIGEFLLNFVCQQR